MQFIPSQNWTQSGIATHPSRVLQLDQPTGKFTLPRDIHHLYRQAAQLLSILADELNRYKGSVYL